MVDSFEGTSGYAELTYPPSEFILETTDFPELGEKRVGKVRDVYVQPDQVLMVATDRYSAFDRNLALVPYKGEISTQVSRFWFDRTGHIIDNHVLDYPDPNVTVGLRCQVLPVEMIVRGFITGVTNTSLWSMYSEGRRDFGNFVLPDGLSKNQQLSEPVVTPTTKFEKHDRPLTLDEIVGEGLVDQVTLDRLVDTSLELFRFGQTTSRDRGLTLVDTKYEFGLTTDGRIILIDELHTPDSSRFWLSEDYQQCLEAGVEPENYDKEFLRKWFKANSSPYEDELMPTPPIEVIEEQAARYAEVFTRLTGQRFVPNLEVSIIERVRQNLKAYSLS